MLRPHARCSGARRLAEHSARGPCIFRDRIGRARRIRRTSNSS
jgi:hypothetical protein